MLEVKIIIEATELANAINNFATAMGDAKKPISAPTAAPTTPITHATTPVIPVAQMAAPAPATNATVNYPSPGVPLAQPPKYTKDQIMTAGAMLMDAGKANELMNLLHSFGVQAVMDLKPEQLGAFATALRDLGAKI